MCITYIHECIFTENMCLSFGPGTAMSITTAANWIGNFTIAMATPLLLGSNWGGLPGTAGTFFLLTVFIAIAFLFVLLVLPETKVTMYMYSVEGLLLFLYVQQ